MTSKIDLNFTPSLLSKSKKKRITTCNVILCNQKCVLLIFYKKQNQPFYHIFINDN